MDDQKRIWFTAAFLDGIKKTGHALLELMVWLLLVGYWAVRVFG
jgi:hypothetical protein